MYQPPTTTSNYNPYANHYPTQYPQNTSPAIPYFPPFPPLQPIQPLPVLDLTPDLTTVTPEIASRTLQRLISFELRDATFDSAHANAVKRLEIEVVAFVQQLFGRAHEYANLSNRAGAIATDLIRACEEFNMPPEALRPLKARARKRNKKDQSAPMLLPAPSRSPSPDMLPSDDEGVLAAVPSTLRMLPKYFPTLPPKHTYLRTPASPPKKAALPSLEKKLKTAGLVQESLRNLLLATEDSTNQEDAELLGHIVNWEVGTHPRKRWKTSRNR